eukprot:NODE_15531_length_1045_cov_6.300654.p1 GENE.NODE_15531_length_1045_cov_6.300654~~NODE_15531_length_1045_cov_6.300654.p1  ORF type:complete len:338 (+),score=81.35 NODE_15531_length_1045_cov_6.300654:37-1014(+)
MAAAVEAAEPRALLPGGAWPAMITPFTAEGAVDYLVLGALIEWYIDSGCDGLFAVCQSSEMYALSEEERLELASFVRRRAAGRCPVVACGNCAGGSVADQAAAVGRMAPLVDAVVLVTCMLVEEAEPDEAWKARMAELMQLTDCPLGLYEVPVPYKRLLSPELLAWCATSGRFLLHKDTCCDRAQIKAKIDALAAIEGGHPLRFLNANVETLLYSNECGGAGFCGISANFYPWLLVALCDPATSPGQKALIQSFVSVGEQVVVDGYPCSAKEYLVQYGLPIRRDCRVRDFARFSGAQQLHLQDLMRLMEHICQQVGVKPRAPTVH